jgi:drug/metabolite transporter (DMT)-like permease
MFLKGYIKYVLCWNQNIQQFTVRTHKSDKWKGSIYISINKMLQCPLLLLCLSFWYYISFIIKLSVVYNEIGITVEYCMWNTANTLVCILRFYGLHHFLLSLWLNSRSIKYIMYLCVCVYVCTHLCMYKCMYVYMYVHTYLCVCVWVYVDGWLEVSNIDEIVAVPW